MHKIRIAAAALLALFATAMLVERVQAAGPVPGERQIHWQRSVEDALAIAKEEDRPILIAVNMDGESACERIVRERYRDPAFVATTRPLVCLVASVFRHTPRDHDEAGRRIPCPRLGEVTCGEHIALEPLLFDKYLSDGDRVAPRHALVLQDGKKAFDLYLLFDLRDLDKKLAESSATESARRRERGLDPGTGAVSAPGADPTAWYRNGASARSNLSRTLFEEQVAKDVAAGARAHLAGTCSAIAEHGNEGSVAALRVLYAGAPRLDAELRTRLVEVARARKLEAAMSGVLRDQIRALGRFPGSIDADGTEVLLPMLAELDGKGAATRSLLLGAASIQAYGKGAAQALEIAFTAKERSAITDASFANGRAFSLVDLLEVAREVTRTEGRSVGKATSFPRPGPPSDAMPEAVELERTLAELETAMKERADDPELLGRYAKAALDLGRRRIESGQQGAQFLLEDAEHFLAKALEKKPRDYALWIERARTAYYLGRLEDEARHGRSAVGTRSGSRHFEIPNESVMGTSVRAREESERLMRSLSNQIEWSKRKAELEAKLGDLARAQIADTEHLSWLDDARVVEALRWIGDADARLIAERSGNDPGVEVGGLIEGARALGLVAASPYGDATDWTSFASFYGALGLWREELAILQEGALRLPGAQEIRLRMNNALWNGGRIDLAPFKADWIAGRHPESADALWYAGYAWILAAEDHRRREEPDAAVEAYATAQQRYDAVIALRPDYAENARHWIGMTWLGRGFAHLLVDRREEAGDALASAIAAKPAVVGARDGLDREAIDLLDGVLEWRASGPSPVDAVALLGKLEAADPGNAFWAVSVSDSELREALRADGRNEQRVERDTVDASGRPVRMALGLPTAEGDAYLRRAIEAGRHAERLGETAEGKRRLAQALTIWAERMHARDRIGEARAELAEAAGLLALEGPQRDADPKALEELAERLRKDLGDARPRFRPGR